MKPAALLALAGALIATPAWADTTVIHAGAVVVDAQSQPLGASTITVTDGRIVGVADGHAPAPEGAVVVSATFRGRPGEPAAIQAEMDRISASREASQPLRSKTGGSTFKNPDGHKAWQLVDEAGCRGLVLGGAQVSEKHTNFLINTGDATSADIEALGEEVRRRVKAKSGVELQWEIQRVGVIK